MMGWPQISKILLYNDGMESPKGNFAARCLMIVGVLWGLSVHAVDGAYCQELLYLAVEHDGPVSSIMSEALRTKGGRQSLFKSRVDVIRDGFNRMKRKNSDWSFEEMSLATNETRFPAGSTAFVAPGGQYVIVSATDGEIFRGFRYYDFLDNEEWRKVNSHGDLPHKSLRDPVQLIQFPR